MPLPNGYRFTTLTPDDKRVVLELDTWAFPISHDTETLVGHEFWLPWDRAVGVTHQDDTTELAAFRASHEFATFQVPGAEVAAAGLTWVGVQPSHRRRGLLRAMITDHFEHCGTRSESISALFAAESGIYGRFGYGSAAQQWGGSLPRNPTLRPVPGSQEHTARFERLDRGKHLETILDLHQKAGRGPMGLSASNGLVLNRPGSVTPTRHEHAHRYWYDPVELREGKEAIRILTVSLGEQVRGFATFTRQANWRTTGADATVQVSEAVALDGASAHALWTALLDIDLAARINVTKRPLDDAILQLLLDPRAPEPVVNDNLWIRLVDAPTALTQRRYTSDLDVVLEVTDDMLPQNAGRWHLRAAAFGTPEITPSSAPADVQLDTRELATIYLGGVSLAALGAAGLVTELTPGALARTSAAFSWPIAPGTTWAF